MSVSFCSSLVQKDRNSEEQRKKILVVDQDGQVYCLNLFLLLN